MWGERVASNKLIGLLRNQTFREFYKIVAKYKGFYAADIVTNIMITALTLVFAEISRKLFDELPDISADTLTMTLTAFVTVTVVRLVVTYLSSWVRSILNETVVFQMRSEILNHMQRLPLGFHEENHSSKAHNIFRNELETAKQFVVSDIQQIITLPTAFVLIGYYLFTVHYALGLVAICVGPLQLLSNLVFKKKYYEIYEKSDEVDRDLFHIIGETLQGIREVKANLMENSVQQKMELIRRNGIHTYVKLAKLETVRYIVKEIPSQFGYILGIGFGVVIMATGEIGPGGLVVFITLLDKVSQTFTSIVDMINNLQRSVSGAKRLFEVMELPGENANQGRSFAAEKPSIRYSGISFAYNQNQTVLRDIHVEVPGGSSLAVIGPSGSGKSTLVKLLLRFYEPLTGTIEIEGIPHTQYSLQALRSKIAWVSQDIYMFDSSIAENIAFGNAEATREEIVQAAILAEAYSFIDALPNKFDTRIGERGIKLSHGQKQRIAIARAILRKASILILDEPTSALDVETEASIQERLGEWADRCTKIVIAHRLSTIRNADLVMFLDNGEVLEYGVPQELLETDSHFRRYMNKQARA